MRPRRQVKTKKAALTTAAVAAGVALFIFDELLFGAPVLAVTKWIGAWPAFLALVPIYFAFDFMLGTLTLEGVKRWQASGRQNKWSKKFSETRDTNVGKFSYWLVVSGGTVGFIVCSFLGTALLTMPIIYLLGRRQNLRVLTALSAAIYALTFVGQYAGIGALLF